MAWLFVQVWMWSLVAFVVGAVLSWLLFARPLRRRLRELEEVVRRQEYDDHRPEPMVTGESAWELLCPRDEEEVEPAGDRPFRTGRVIEDDEEAAVTAVLGTASGEWTDDSELRLEEQRELAARQEGVDRVGDAETVRQLPEPTAPPELDRPRTELADEEPGEPAVNGWFRGPEPAENTGGHEWSGTSGDAEDAEQFPEQFPEQLPERTPEQGAERAAEAEQPAERDVEREPDPEQLSGRLRSLFEPLGGSGADRRPGPVPPVGAETTQHFPTVDDRSHDDSGPEAGTEASRDAGYTVKGHFASRQYHTPDSPRFESITAEVWFRTAADAEQAGFEPWDGHHRS